ncbi:MAG: hypothetical protein A2142_03275 [candidate division Zixibacteria bacterium RBG_16_48_11]|nr:MAG: hypothetical protein A2142_03275 [candidate division Zixibacteria bacterium RBG_16_48_11]
MVNKFLRKLIRPPVRVRHAEHTFLFSADDDISQPSHHLISLALHAVQFAQEVSLADISARMKKPPYYPEIWPGEHYKLLAGLVATLKPKMIVELGTATGLSALAMCKYLPPESTLVTFDLIGWKSFPDTCFRESDFKDKRLIQYVDDLSSPAIFPKYTQILEKAEIIFVDAAKDGIMEQRFLDNLRSLSADFKPFLVFDDIRLWNMLKIWRNIPFPKLDLTSFGHWSGTGLVEWR